MGVVLNASSCLVGPYNCCLRVTMVPKTSMAQSWASSRAKDPTL